MKRKQGFAVTPYKGDNHWKYNGGVAIISGYRAIKNPTHPYAQKTGYVFEHRLVMEKQLSRYLLPHEKVHHINGDITDNSPENLVVLTHKKHIRNHIGSSNADFSKLDDPRWLYHQYVTIKKPYKQIAKELGCSEATVRKFLDEHNIHHPKKRSIMQGH